ncbi:DUF262 domain-containing protein [Henriciella sp.]|uniref:GmrSD restriction endonuclease domain-containing protein n=1 Tax=Henriciella sp. TaxID=1968823 RepID=UPI0025B7DE2D|nr:DUF262 domain-containing protein [Henriciella sp.]
MANYVNLDALIPREDFETTDAKDDGQSRAQTMTVRDLESNAFFYLALRKPDFQRETSEWNAARVAGLIKTFIEGDLIPSIILWKHREHIFVIDGSHRLSALIAWVQDDYGDGDLSKKFHGDSIAREQLDYAAATRKRVHREVGSYEDYRNAAVTPDDYAPEMSKNARALGSRAVTLQWVTGDSVKAENSFIRINQQAAKITPQELKLIEGRHKPDVIAARAIIKRGLLHHQGATFAVANQEKISEVSRVIHDRFFRPELTYPIKSLGLPMGGSAYAGTSLKMVHDFIGLSSPAETADSDFDGDLTLDHLKVTRRLADLLCSNEPASLGLHPAIYFYSWTGKHQPILLLSVAELMMEHRRNKTLPKFIAVRSKLERFILGNRSLLNQIVRKFGTKESGKKHIKDYYNAIIEEFAGGKSDSAVIEALTANPQFTYLQPSESPYAGVSPGKYNTNSKSAALIQELIPSAPTCKICGGLVPEQSISVDHKVSRSMGGDSHIENLQISHPFCNTGIKGQQESQARLDI